MANSTDLSIFSVTVGAEGASAASKPWLLMMHGWGKNHLDLRPMAELLSTTYRVLLVDLPGFGRSALPKEVWGTRDYAERLYAHLDQQGIGRCDVLGHSFGGRVAIRMAALCPDRVGRLFLVASSGIPRPRSFAQLAKMRVLGLVRSILKFCDKCSGTHLFANWFVPRFASRDYLQAGALRPIFVKTVNEDASEDARKIKAPTLLLWGQEDMETPVALGQRLHQLINGSEMLVFPGRGHEPFENAGHHLLTTYITRFLEAHAA
ncbi:MAG: alpha/beta hydrolase [Oligoflexia bacterium]|nr:alpha/beta hydrolase [Oligoflexia bacterium]